MNAVRNLSLYLLVGLAAVSGCSSSQRSGRAVMPVSSYTTAQALHRPGLSNLYQVSDALYRGALPEDEGLASLDAMGIKTVVDLCLFHSEEEELEKYGIRYVGIPMAPWDPKEKQLREFLDVVTDPANQPVFLHCKRGADRTGTFVAGYRMVVEGWTTEQAVLEMTEGPFDFHEFWSGLPRFLRKLDVEKLRREFGTQAATAQANIER